MKTLRMTGKTVDEAIEKALSELGRTLDEVQVTILEAPSKGFLGFGAKPAVIEVTAEEAAPAEPEAPQKESEPEITAPEKEPAAEAAEVQEEEIPVRAERMKATPEEEAEAAERGKAFLLGVLEKMNLSVMIEKMRASERVVLHIRGKDLGILIGKHGQTLDALQYLTNLAANKGSGSHVSIMVDVENYRSRREETLKNLARRLAGRVKRSRTKVVLEPMNGYERKIIHMALQDNPMVRTESEGEDPYRHVVIYYNR